jgi:acyl-coenzyme A synthetase/AMP-(fatty) acid ligase
MYFTEMEPAGEDSYFWIMGRIDDVIANSDTALER